MYKMSADMGEGGYQNLIKGSNHILLVTHDHMQSFKIVAYFHLGYFWLVGWTEGRTGEIKGFLRDAIIKENPVKSGFLQITFTPPLPRKISGTHIF